MRLLLTILIQFIISSNSYCYGFPGKSPISTADKLNFLFVKQCGLNQAVKNNKIIISGANNKTRVEIILPIPKNEIAIKDINDSFDGFFSEKEFFCSNYSSYDDNICPDSFFKSMGCCPIAPNDKHCLPYWFESQGEVDKYKNFLSYYFNESFYIGAAHESSVISTYVYDLKANKRIFINDILNKNNQDSLEEISKILKSKLRKKLKQNFDEGSSPILDNYSSFFIHDGLITFIFQPYQVTGFADGIQKIDLPISEVLKFLNPIYFER